MFDNRLRPADADLVHALQRYLGESFAVRFFDDTSNSTKAAAVGASFSVYDREADRRETFSFVQLGTGQDGSSLAVFNDSGRIRCAATKDAGAWMLHGVPSREASELIAKVKALLDSPSKVAPYHTNCDWPMEYLRAASTALGLTRTPLAAIEHSAPQFISENLGRDLHLTQSLLERGHRPDQISKEMNEILGFRSAARRAYLAAFSDRIRQDAHRSETRNVREIADNWLADVLDFELRRTGVSYRGSDQPVPPLDSVCLIHDDDLLTYLSSLTAAHVADTQLWPRVVQSLAWNRAGSESIALEHLKTSFLNGNVEETAIALFSIFCAPSLAVTTKYPTWRKGTDDSTWLPWGRLVHTFESCLLNYQQDERNKFTVTKFVKLVLSEIAPYATELDLRENLDIEAHTNHLRIGLQMLFLDAAESLSEEQFSYKVFDHPFLSKARESTAGDGLTVRIRHIALLGESLTEESSKEVRRLVKKCFKDSEHNLSSQEKYLLLATWMRAGGECDPRFSRGTIIEDKNCPEYYLYAAEYEQQHVRNGESDRHVVKVLERGITAFPNDRRLIMRLQAQHLERGRIAGAIQVVDLAVQNARDKTSILEILDLSLLGPPMAEAQDRFIEYRNQRFPPGDLLA